MCVHGCSFSLTFTGLSDTLFTVTSRLLRGFLSPCLSQGELAPSEESGSDPGPDEIASHPPGMSGARGKGQGIFLSSSASAVIS